MDQSTTFKQAHGILKRHAETLRNQVEPDIDSLVPIVTESLDAYRICKERCDTVEKLLAQSLGGNGADGAAT